MKKITAGVLCLLLLISGCGKAGPGPEQVREIYQNTLAAAHYRVRTYGGFCCEYLLELQEGENGFSVTVLEPASVAGIRAEVAADGSAICYEDITLDALLPEPGGFAPADALPCLLRQLRAELPAGAGEVSTDRGQRLRLEYQMDLPDGTRAQKRIFLLPESLFPESAELYLGGALQLTLQVEEFSLTPREPVAPAPELWYTESVTAFVGRA